MKNVLIINSTYRKGGNSQVLAEQFKKGAQEAGNTVTEINLRDINLKFCIGCLSCQKTGKCVLDDSVNGLLPIVQNADVLVFATPVYYYSVSGQLKTFLDRLNPLYGRDNKFKEVYLLTTAADTETSAMDGSIKAVQGWIDCFEGVKLSGVVYGVGADAVGTVQSTVAFTQAYEMGKNL